MEGQVVVLQAQQLLVLLLAVLEILQVQVQAKEITVELPDDMLAVLVAELVALVKPAQALKAV
jgi:hypothetical protein